MIGPLTEPPKVLAVSEGLKFPIVSGESQSLLVKYQKPLPWKLVGAALGHHRKVGGLRELRAVTGRIDTELGDSFD